MSQDPAPLFGTIRTHVNFWPSYVDILTIVLMVLALQSVLQTFVSKDYLEIIKMRQAQQNLAASLEKEFSAEKQDKAISFEMKPNLLQIRFSEKILFRSREYALQPMGAEIISRCANVLRQKNVAPYGQIQVEGHTDNVPLVSVTYPHNNWELSTARALTVVQQMLADGIDPEKISASGYAEFSPAVDNDSDEKRQQNRRIELRIFFSTPNQNRQARAP